jgi:anti-anti-sigma factor
MDDITIEVVTPGAWLRLAGRLSAATVPDVRLALSDAVDSGVEDLVIDLRDVDLVDATGLGVLVAAHRRALRAGRRLVLRSVPPKIDRLFAITRLHRVLHVEPLEVAFPPTG